MTVNSSIGSGHSSSFVVSSGTVLEVLAGGTAFATTIDVGGTEDVFGLDSGGIVSGGSQYVSSGGTVSMAVVSAGAEYVVSGGQAFGVVLSAGAQYVSASGLANATSVYSGGAQSVLAGGTASASVLSGGNQYVSSGGTAIATQVGNAAPFLVAGASLGTEFVSAGGVASGTIVYVSGALSVAASGSAVSATLSGGLATVASGGVAIATTITDGAANRQTVVSGVYDLVSVVGTQTVQSGGLAQSTIVTSGGELFVAAGGSASNTDIVSGTLVDAGGAVTGGVTLGGGGAVLVLSTSILPSAVVSGFVAGVGIDFAGVAPASSGSIVLDAANHRIDVGGTQQLLLDPLESFAGETLHYAADTGAGTIVTLACFAEGTRIATPGGEVPVETLRPGQTVLTLDGGAAPVLWLAVQSVSPRFADPLRVLPIRIRAGALADNVPCRDLLVSPCHALLVDGLLVEAHALLNGRSIARVARMADTFRYYHVQLPDHAVILADGAGAESFFDELEAFAFDNPAQRVAHAGTARPLPYPRVKARRQVPAAIHARLAARADALVPGPNRAVA